MKQMVRTGALEPVSVTIRMIEAPADSSEYIT